MMKTTHCCNDQNTPWYQRKLIVASILCLTILTITPFITQDFQLLTYANTLFSMMWLAILLGLLISGIIETFIPKNYIEKLLASSKKRTLLTAAILGILLSTCSHGVLAISMQLYKKGASIPAVIVLLTSSPWANLPITILLWTFFGKLGFLIIILAIAISLVTGLLFQQLAKFDLIEKNIMNFSANTPSFSIIADIKHRFKNYPWNMQTLTNDAKSIIKGSIAISDMVIWWFIIAFTMASFIGYYIPPTIFQTYLSSSVTGLFNTLGIATILEVCSEGSSVLAFELYNQTQSLGNVFVFLLAGVATDYTEIGLLWSTIGKRTAILLPLVSVPIILLVGYLLTIFI